MHLAEVVRAGKPLECRWVARIAIPGCVSQTPRGGVLARNIAVVFNFLGTRLDFPHNLLYCQIRAQNNKFAGSAT